jgi:hypothetical protein
METLKSLAQVLQIDRRNLMFVDMDTLKPPTLEEHHKQIAGITLNANVPEEVRSYFATVQNVCLYAWFAYDFYAVANLLCYTAIELALRQRMPVARKDARSLQNLVEKAVSQGLLKDKGFSHVRRIRMNLARDLRFYRSLGGGKVSRSAIPKINYAKTLLKTLAPVRNSLAHPRLHAILMPTEALSELQLTAEIINQLFPA